MSQDATPWYTHKVYSRYWKHYSQAMEWMCRHKNAYRKAMESLYNQSFFPPQNQPSQRYADWGEENPLRSEPNSSFTRSHTTVSRSRGLHTPRTTKRRVEEVVSESDTESEDDEGIEYDLSNMEITEELRQYFEQTERHREELCKYLSYATVFKCLLQYCLFLCNLWTFVPCPSSKELRMTGLHETSLFYLCKVVSLKKGRLS